MAVCAVAMPVSALELPDNQKTKQSAKAEYVEGEVIAVLKDTAPKSYLKASKTAAIFGKGFSMDDSFTFKSKNGNIRALVLKSATKTTDAIIKELKKNENIKYAFPNYKVKASDITNDTYSSYQWALENNGLNGGTENLDTNPEAMWEAADSSEKEQVVAIVDTGIDFEHEDLKDVLWTNPYGSKLVGKHGYDFSDTIKDHTPLDDNGHGTHVAGIIAGVSDNEKGISGINKKNVKIMSLKFLDEDGEGTTEGALASYEYILRAIDLGANVVSINNSWGGLGDKAEQMLFDDIFDSFGEKGAITVCAAGNETLDLSNPFGEEESTISLWYDDEYVVTPATSESEYCLTVAATNEKDELAGFSNYSKDYVDVAAPGTSILSSVSYNCYNPSAYSAEQKAALCDAANTQDYNGTVTSTDFGYPNFFMLADDSDPSYDILGKDTEVTQSDDGFGKDGKSLNIKFKDYIDEDDEDSLFDYSFEIPFTIEDENKPYSISFMLKANKGLYGLVADVPADFDVAKNLTNLGFLVQAEIYSTEAGNYWSHKTINIKPSDLSKKYRSKNRKLVFIAETYKNDSVMKIDDLSISSQSVDPSDFGKYDFYNGTSMATPYVTGAAALVSAAYPDADAAEVVNIIKNTGRISADLDGKTENGRVLSLDNTDKTPAMLVSAKYNKDGDIEVKGSFKNNTSFKINGEAVTPKSANESVAVFEDNSYNTKKAVIEAENIYGSDSIAVLLSNKTAPDMNPQVIGMPMMSNYSGYNMPQGAITIPAGDKSYFVGEGGEIGAIAYDEFEDAYLYDDMLPQIDTVSLFKNPKGISIKSAVYRDGKIYFDAVNEVYSEYSGYVIGYDGAFGYLDLETGETKVLCETPNASALGSSLALYNGKIYLIGGYDREANTFSKYIYKYNFTTKTFDKSVYTLPEGRAFTRFIQFENTLIGVYGAQKDGKLPKIIKFDGSAWSTSNVEAESDDFLNYWFGDGDGINAYFGNVGYSAKGIYLNGAYIYGCGDTYIYTVSTDKLSASKYSFSNEIGENKLLATTLPGAFIGYPISTEDDDFIVGGSVDVPDDDDELAVAYCYGINNNYSVLDDSSLTGAYISNEHFTNYAYGDSATLKVSPKSGYILKSVSVDGVKLASGSTTAKITFSKAKHTITAETKRVSPDKVKGVKAVLDSGKKNYKISWKKPARAQGYQVQTYKNGSWKTVKTLTSGSTLKCTVSKSKAGKKFRVRAFAKYNSKKYYGSWSSVYTVK